MLMDHQINNGKEKRKLGVNKKEGELKNKLYFKRKKNLRFKYHFVKIVAKHINVTY